MKVVSFILVIVLIGGCSAAFVDLNSPSLMKDSSISVEGFVENVYPDKFTPNVISYWGSVQNLVNQGPGVVKTKWSVGDLFVDSFNGSSVMVRLVDIAEDGTCTFMMDPVLEAPLTYDIITYDLEDYEINLDFLYSDDEEGNRTWYPLVVRGELGEYFLVLYEPPEDKLLLEYHWKANGMYEPDWMYTEHFDFNVDYSLISLGTTFDPSVLNSDYYHLEEINCDGSYMMTEWVELDPKYKTCVSEDLKNYAVDFRLPYAEELGIGDLKGNGAAQDVIWDCFKDLYSFDENSLTVTDQNVYMIHYFEGGALVEAEMNYSLFMGDQVNFWLEDTATPEFGHPSRFYVDESGQLLLIDKLMPLPEPISGAFMPCFKIVPQR